MNINRKIWQNWIVGAGRVSSTESAHRWNESRRLEAAISRSFAFVALGWFASGSLIHAQSDPVAKSVFTSSRYDRAVDDAIMRGREMYRYDQAALLASERLVQDWQTQSTTDLRGYVVLPVVDDRLSVVFYGEDGGTLLEFARYEVDGGEVVGGGPIEGPFRSEMSTLAKRLVAAREAAIEEARKQAFSPCNQSRPNLVVLPPDANDIVSVYLLTSPISRDTYPVGGHYRVDIGANGDVVGSRRFLNTCFVANFSNSAKDAVGGDDGVAVVISHLLDAQPTEAHAFVSYYMPIPMIVATTNSGLTWRVELGLISYIGALEKTTNEDGQEILPQ